MVNAGILGTEEEERLDVSEFRKGLRRQVEGTGVIMSFSKDVR